MKLIFSMPGVPSSAPAHEKTACSGPPHSSSALSMLPLSRRSRLIAFTPGSVISAKSMTTTSAPSSWASAAAAAPMPVAPPTTSTRLPSKRNFSAPMSTNLLCGTEQPSRPHERQVEMRLDAWLGGDDGGDGVHRVHRRPHAAPVSLVTGRVLPAGLERDVHRGGPVDLERVLDGAVTPVRVEGVVHLPEAAEDDDRAAGRPRDPFVAHAADRALRDVPRPDVEVALGHGDVELGGRALDVDAEPVGD